MPGIKENVSRSLKQQKSSIKKRFGRAAYKAIRQAGEASTELSRSQVLPEQFPFWLCSYI